MARRLSVLLGLRDKVETNFKNMVDDMFKKFKNNQGLFIGQRNTYQPLEGYADEPSKRGFTNVQSTVEEQLEWMKEHTKDFMDVVFSIEKTNASGKVKSKLVVDGQDWGEYTSLELLRLKTTLDNSKFKELYKEIPVRSSAEIWKLSENPDFEGRDVWETPIDEGFAKTTIKESYILLDTQEGRPPMVAEKSSQVNVGKYTSQRFSGALSIQERAVMQRKYDTLYKAVIEALENANNVEIETSDLGSKIMTYIHS